MSLNWCWGLSASEVIMKDIVKSTLTQTRHNNAETVCAIFGKYCNDNLEYLTGDYVELLINMIVHFYQQKNTQPIFINSLGDLATENGDDRHTDAGSGQDQHFRTLSALVEVPGNATIFLI